MPVSDTAPVRPGEELNIAALSEHLNGKLPCDVSSIQLEQFPGGHSNLTYLLRAGGQEYVLRRGPLGPVAPKAHDMAREFRILKSVHPHFPAAPNVFLLCEDISVLGCVFFIMERRRGEIIRDIVPSQFQRLPDFQGILSRAFINSRSGLGRPRPANTFPELSVIVTGAVVFFCALVAIVSSASVYGRVAPRRGVGG